MESVVRDYMTAMRRRRLAGGTIEARARIVRAWIAHHPAWQTATWRDVEAYGDTRAVAATTWRDEISHLHAFYMWAVRNELADHDPTVLVERPRVPVRLPRPISPAQYARLADDCTPVMLGMLELMAFCGLRCAEVAALRWTDVDLVERVALVHGKGNRDRYVGLPLRVVRALAALDHPGVYVFQRQTGGPLTPAMVSVQVGKYMRARGVAGSAHRLRHSFATALLAAAGDVSIVQHALGHVSISSTQIYAKVDRERVLTVARMIDSL